MAYAQEIGKEKNPSGTQGIKTMKLQENVYFFRVLA